MSGELPPSGATPPEPPPVQEQGGANARQLLVDLLTSSRRQESVLTQGLEALRADIDMLWHRVDALTRTGSAPETASPPATPPTPEPAPAAPPAAPPAPVVEEQPRPMRAESVRIVTDQQPGRLTNDVDWETLILGRDLAGNPELESYRKDLVQGLFRGEPEPTSLVGQLLMFRGATPERMPVLLKDLGEAYYRWQPESGRRQDDPMRDALIQWIESSCERAGIGNRIELAHIGDRFDMKRHNAKQRGAEVCEIYGWVVVRDNGQVYTKASVAVQ